MNNALLQRTSTIFLQGVLLLVGFGTIVALLWEPHFEGRNVNATWFEVYFNDPFLVYVYIGSIAFFVALYQVWKFLGYIGHNTVFSAESIKALRTIRYCAGTLVVLIAGAVMYLGITMHGKDDIAGGVAMGLFAICVSGVMGAVAVVLEGVVEKKM